jgi:FtsP/CotA-like multicopper oxidase with cupredoxin domain
MLDTGEAPMGDIDFSQGPPKFLGYKTLTVNGNQDQGDYIIRFEVSAVPVNDPSQVPPVLRKNPALPRDLIDPMTNQLKSRDKLKALPNNRSFEFAPDSSGREWVINGRPFHTSPAGAAKLGAGRLDVPRNSLLAGADAPDGEIWTITNTGAWAHPVHIHLEEFQVLLRNGNPPKEWERCKKDVLRLDPLDEVQIFLRFRDFLGKYPIHCHNVLHEDHEMMLRFDVVGDS